MTIQEIQQAIDDKDYVKFEDDTTIWKLLRARDTSLRGVTFDSDFFQISFCQQPSSRFETEYWIDDVILSLTRIFYVPTIEDYIALFDMLERLNQGMSYFENGINMLIQREHPGQSPKPDEYLNVLIDYIKRDKIKYANLTIFKPTKAETDALSETNTAYIQEKINLPLEDYNDRRIASIILNHYEIDTLIGWLGSKEALMERFKLLSEHGVDASVFFSKCKSHYDFDDIVEVVRNWNNWDITRTNYFFDSVELTEEQRRELINLDNGLSRFSLDKEVLRQFSVAEFREISRPKQDYFVLMCTDATLSDFADNASEGSLHSTAYITARLRFYTEEEIAKYPHMFDPEVMKNSPMFYISKDTFKLLNSAYGKRQRWPKELIEFDEILTNTQRDTLGVDDVLYLAEKTNVSNAQLLDTLKSLNLKAYKRLEHLKTLQIFLGDD